MRELRFTHMVVFSRLRVNFKFIDSKVCNLQLTHYDPMAGENVYAINEATNMIKSPVHLHLSTTICRNIKQYIASLRTNIKNELSYPGCTLPNKSCLPIQGKTALHNLECL